MNTRENIYLYISNRTKRLAENKKNKKSYEFMRKRVANNIANTSAMAVAVARGACYSHADFE